MTLDATGAWQNLAAFTSSKPQVTNYGYDRLYQLTSVRAPGQETSYAYDPVGNRLSVAGGGTTTPSTYDKADRILSAGNSSCDVDADGNLVSGCAFSNAYDAANRLISASGVVSTNYTLDGDGKRSHVDVAGNPNSHHFDYVYDVNGALPAVLVDGNSNGSLKYVWGPAGLAYAVDQSNSVTVYHPDGLGSVRALTDGSGTIIETYRSDAYGVPTSTQGGVNQHFQYTGQERDEDGLVFLRGRVYNPTLGRFLQRDPLIGVPGLPLSLNPYAYALNNPASRTDSSGLSTDDTLLGILSHKLIESYFVNALMPGRGYQTEVRIPVGASSGYRRLDIARPDTGSRVKRQYGFYEIKPDTERSAGISDILLDINFGRNLTPAYMLIPDSTSFPDFYIASVPEWFLHVWLDRGAPGSPAVTGLILYRWEYVPWWLPDPALGPETEPELPEPLPKQLPLPI